MSSPAAGSCFSASWLALREPVDHRSRAGAVTRRAAAWLRDRRTAAGPPPLVVDLGSGSGSNRRYLRAQFQGPLQWRLVDQDAQLLARGAQGVAVPDTIQIRQQDLSQGIEAAIAHADLVSASALLDLVSASWLARLLDACAAQQCGVLMALTIDGRLGFSRRDPLDRAIWSAVARDQHRDKGLGPALASAAPARLGQALRARGYRVFSARSDWVLGRADGPLAQALVTGWVQAAQRACPALQPTARAWAARRLAALAAGRSTVRVGHQDVLGLPPGDRCT